MVLLAVCDAHYRFIMVDIGDAGRHSDGGILPNSKLPPDGPLHGTSTLVPYVFVGDESFPLKNHMIHSYPGRKSF